MRVFAALPLPPALSSFVQESGKVIKKQYKGIRVVGSTAMHITLYFFGEIEQDKIEVLFSIMQNPLLKRPQFSISLGALDQFPARGKPRVLYYDIIEGKKEVCDIFSVFRGLIADKGWPVEDNERPFTPHITIARNKFERIDLSSLKVMPAAEGSFQIECLVNLSEHPWPMRNDDQCTTSVQGID